MDEELFAEKDSCRRYALRMRNALSPAARERKSREVWERFLTMPEVAKSRTVLLYASYRSEVETLGLVERLVGEGKTVVLPVVLADSPNLILRQVTSTNDLVTGAFGIRVPSDDAPEISYESIDIAALPGVGFDLGCWRVGYGGGFYDRLLARGPVFSVGFAFACQIMPRVPTECHDERLDAVVTEDRLIRPDASSEI